MGVEERTTEIVVVADPSAVASPPAGASPLAPPILLLVKRRRLLFEDTRELRALGETLRRRSVQHPGAPISEPNVATALGDGTPAAVARPEGSRRTAHA
jgi:hypothetical protein